MKAKRFSILAVLFALPLAPTDAAVRYVNLVNPNPESPYTTWNSAATNIQDAVDAAGDGDEIMVTNGVYATGGRAVDGSLLTNRVAVTRPVVVRSVNGPGVTEIRGYQVPGTTNGDGAVRCVYLTEGAILIGFTLTNGATRDFAVDFEASGGGLCCTSVTSIASNCLLVGNSAFISGGGAAGGTLNHCRLTGNSAQLGGGAYNCDLNNCTLTGNSVSSGEGAQLPYGGGAMGGSLNYCLISSNWSQLFGGGAFAAALTNCTLVGNRAINGGGAISCGLDNSVIRDNTAFLGGGASMSWLLNCTLTGNFATNSGGGVHSSELTNCIVYYNTSLRDGANYDSISFLDYSCTTPLPSDGEHNISAEPQLASALHLSVGSPCRAAGAAAYATGHDIDGEPWLDPPSIGCDELHPAAVTGALSVAISASHANVAMGFEVDFTAQIDGRTSQSRWDFGDGTVVSNRPYVSHVWTTPGVYSVVLQAYNDSHPEGVSAVFLVRVVDPPTYYVVAGGSSPVPPYDSWSTAATNIQDAVDAAPVAGATVLVSNGVYRAGLVLAKPLTMRSLNGPAVTVIDGGSTGRCVVLAARTMAVGFTLTNGFADRGGGVWCESLGAVVSNCVISGNSAAISGGGIFSGTFNNCTLTGNSAGEDGGGAWGSCLNNCTLSGNDAYAGGGVAVGSLNNCTLAGNFAMHGGGALGGYLTNCTLTGNSSLYSAGGAFRSTMAGCTLAGNSSAYGGGAFLGTLNNCILLNNSAEHGGGVNGLANINGGLPDDHLRGRAGDGTFSAASFDFVLLKNCTVVGNSADSGGGIIAAWADNCVIYYNTGRVDRPNHMGSIVIHSCTIPSPITGSANITNEPAFADLTGGNLRLQSNSPCINAGGNRYVTDDFDFDGHPRIAGGTVDIGAYEFQSPRSILSYAWLQQYGLPTDGSADFTDPDGDQFANDQECRAGTNPTDASSALRLFAPSFDGTNWVVSWQSVLDRTYRLERSKDLTASPNFLPLSLGIPGEFGTLSVTDTNTPGSRPVLYRVLLEE